VLAAVAAERQRQTAAQLAEGARAIASGEREPWTPDLLRRIAGMGVDLAALVKRYGQRTAGRVIDDPNAYLLAMAADAVAKRVGTTREILAAVATDRATLANSAAIGSEARARADNREALAQQLGGGDIAAGYAALAMIPDSPHRRRRVEVASASGGRAAASPAAEGAMQLGTLLPTLDVTTGLAAASTAGGMRP
jgi:hypothetical protein